MYRINRISSRGNDRLVRIRKVRDGKVPDQIFIEGLRVAEETLKSSVRLIECVFTPEFMKSPRGETIIDILAAKNIALYEVPHEVFKSIADTANSQGIVLIAERPKTGYERIFDKQSRTSQPHVIFLHEVSDPSNLGAILRTAEAAGVAGVIISVGSADAFSPKALRSGMGANLRIQIWDGVIFREAFEVARRNGHRLIGADISASASFREINWIAKSLIVFGSEAHGLHKEILKEMDEVIKIPMANGVESLNLAVSAGIILFAANPKTT